MTAIKKADFEHNTMVDPSGMEESAEQRRQVARQLVSFRLQADQIRVARLERAKQLGKPVVSYGDIHRRAEARRSERAQVRS